MRTRASRLTILLTLVPLLAIGLGAASGCGSQEEAAGGSDGTEALAHRARQVAAAWDGSTAAATWRAGYYPMGEEIQLPRGGWRSQVDKQAYEDQSFVLRGTLPDTERKEGRVTWPRYGSLTRPLRGANEVYKSLAGTRGSGKAHLVVTRAKLGEMNLATSRGLATVPAWLFTLDGYATPLKRAAAIPSKLPRPPIKPARDIPGYPISRLVRSAADGRSVTVIALHGVCDGGPEVSVLEASGSIVLSATVKYRKDTGDCTKQAKMQQVAVRLEHPLGDRVLLDAHTGRPILYRGLHGIPPTATAQR